MRRAIVVFIEDKANLLMQFGCLYTSLKYIKASDTDLVVFGTNDVLKKAPDDCIKVECQPLKADIWTDYPYINSISCLTADKGKVLSKYAYLLRTDVDTFLTPAWNDYHPINYSVGRGGYNTEGVNINIMRVARELGLNHKGLHNVGSTHYGESQIIQQVCRLATFITEYLFNVEFKDDPGSWPGWYKGVSTMYANEISINHLVDKVNLDYDKLDFDSARSDTVLEHPHIHCWHHDNRFSKFQFSLGNYDNISADSLDISKVKDYCLFIALKSRKEMS